MNVAQNPWAGCERGYIGTILEASAPPTISLGSLTVGEGEWANFQLTLSQPCDTAVTVHVATANGTGIDGYDFIGLNDTVTFQPGDTSETVPVLARMKGLYTGDHDFRLTADSPSLGTLAEDSSTATIVGAVPTLSLGDVSVREGDTAQFDVTLSRAVAQSLSVDYTVGGGNAVSGVQYDATGGTLVFPVGVTQEWINVPTKNDGWYRGDTNYQVALQNAHGAPLADAAATGTIEDLQSGYVTAADCWAEPGENLVFAVHPIFPHTLPITVGYSMAAADGVAGASGTLTFAAYDSNPQSVFVGTSPIESDADQPVEMYFSGGPTAAGIVYRSPIVVSLDNGGHTAQMSPGTTSGLGLTLSRPTHTTVYATVDLGGATDSAVGGVAYSPTGSQMVVFAPTPAGSSAAPHATLTIHTLAPSPMPVNTTLTFSAVLTSASGADLPAEELRSECCQIVYPGAEPDVAIDSQPVDPGQPVQFRFTLTHPYSGTDENGNPTNVCVVNYRLEDGSAVAGQDYAGDDTLHSVSLCWDDPATRTQTVSVDTYVDPSNEAGSKFYLVADNAAPPDNQTAGEINAEPDVTITAPDTAAGDDMTISVQPVQAVGFDTYYTLQLANDTAVAGTGYEDVGNVTLHFAPHDTTPQTVTVHTKLEVGGDVKDFHVIVGHSSLPNAAIVNTADANILGDSGTLTVYNYDGSVVPETANTDPGAYILPGSSSDPRTTLNEIDLGLPSVGRYLLMHTGGDVHVYRADGTEYDGGVITANQAQGAWHYSLAGSNTSTDFKLVAYTDSGSDMTDEAKATTGVYHMFLETPHEVDLTAAQSTTTVIAGEQLQLSVKVVFPDMPFYNSDALTGSWSISGHPIKSYNLDRDGNLPTYISKADEITSGMYFYWAEGGVQTASASINGQKVSAVICVNRPELGPLAEAVRYDAEAEAGPANERVDQGVVATQDSLSLGRLPSNVFETAGMQFYAGTVNADAYDLEFVQVVSLNYSVWIKASGHGDRWESFGLDGEVPYERYATFAEMGKQGTGVVTFDTPFDNPDSPDSPILSVERAFLATMWILAIPKGGGIYVPIGQLTWGYHAAVTYSRNDGAITSLDVCGAPRSVTPFQGDGNQFPTWSRNLLPEQHTRF